MRLRNFALGLLLLPLALSADYLITTPDSLMSNDGDYLVVTHPSFTSALYPRCRLRDSPNLRVKMAEVSLIYTTFDSGPHPDCIKSFLRQGYRALQSLPDLCPAGR